MTNKCDVRSVDSIGSSDSHDVINEDTSWSAPALIVSGNESQTVRGRLLETEELFDVDITCDLSDDKGLPTVSIKFGDVETNALLDCASKLNLISTDFLFKLGYRDSDIKRTNVRIKGVTGDVSCAYGEIDLSFTLMKREFQARFICVVRAVFPATVLLSYSSMRNFNIVTD